MDKGQQYTLWNRAHASYGYGTQAQTTVLIGSTLRPVRSLKAVIDPKKKTLVHLSWNAPINTSVKVCSNPLAPKSDQHPISPHCITRESNMKIRRIEEMIINWSSSRLLNKFSLSASLEMYGKQYMHTDDELRTNYEKCRVERADNWSVINLEMKGLNQGIQQCLVSRVAYFDVVRKRGRYCTYDVIPK